MFLISYSQRLSCPLTDTNNVSYSEQKAHCLITSRLVEGNLYTGLNSHVNLPFMIHDIVSIAQFCFMMLPLVLLSHKYKKQSLLGYECFFLIYELIFQNTYNNDFFRSETPCKTDRQRDILHFSLWMTMLWNTVILSQRVFQQSLLCLAPMGQDQGYWYFLQRSKLIHFLAILPLHPNLTGLHFILWLNNYYELDLSVFYILMKNQNHYYE